MTKSPIGLFAAVLLVPIEMREWYDNLSTRSHIEAVATYGRFRQFQVNTDQRFLIKQ